jgi:hypothetical protein
MCLPNQASRFQNCIKTKELPGISLSLPQYHWQQSDVINFTSLLHVLLGKKYPKTIQEKLYVRPF